MDIDVNGDGLILHRIFFISFDHTSGPFKRTWHNCCDGNNSENEY